MATLTKKDCNVIMVGKTGLGKSSFGNSLLCQQLLRQPEKKPFTSKKSANSVTVKCERKRCLLPDGTLITVIDTPGLFDTSTPNQDIITEICKCVSLSAPGPDVIVFVLSLKRFTKEEIDTIDILKKLFGEEAMKHVIIVFTGKDQFDDSDDDDDIKTVAEFVHQSPWYLKHLVYECNNRYVGIANKPSSPTHESDVNDVMKLIYKTMDENKNQVYSKEILLKAEKIIQDLIEGRREKTSEFVKKSPPYDDDKDNEDAAEPESEVREEIMKDIESNNEGYLATLGNGLSKCISHAFAVPETFFATGRAMFQRK